MMLGAAVLVALCTTVGTQSVAPCSKPGMKFHFVTGAPCPLTDAVLDPCPKPGGHGEWGMLRGHHGHDDSGHHANDVKRVIAIKERMLAHACLERGQLPLFYTSCTRTTPPQDYTKTRSATASSPRKRGGSFHETKGHSNCGRLSTAGTSSACARL